MTVCNRCKKRDSDVLRVERLTLKQHSEVLGPELWIDGHACSKCVQVLNGYIAQTISDWETELE